MSSKYSPPASTDVKRRQAAFRGASPFGDASPDDMNRPGCILLLVSHLADFSRWTNGNPFRPCQERGLFDLQKSNILHPQSCVGNLYNEEALVANLGFKVRLFVPLFLSKTNNPERYLGVGCKC